MTAARGAFASVAAQAKVNLFLRVLGREASGYHALETLFCRIELADMVRVRPTAGETSLDVTGSVPAQGLGPVERNLAWRAAEMYREQTRWPAGFVIEIEKRIPVGGGLGGGSADAGAVLRALNALAPAPVDESALLEMAIRLGADVPFLTTRAPLALAWGRGERMLSLAPLPRRVMLLLTSDAGVPTADAFRWLAESRGEYRPLPHVIDAASLSSWNSVARLAHNDFEAIISPRFPTVDRALVYLRSARAAELFGDEPIVQMSGSGATVFALRSDDVSVDLDVRVAEGDGMRAVATSSCTHVEEVHVGE